MPTTIFTPLFNEFNVVYRGITDAYIGPLDQDDPLYHEGYNDPGVLYAIYYDGNIHEIGPVTAYAAEVLEAIREGRTPPTEQQWLATLTSTTVNAETSEAYAKGTINNVPAVDGQTGYHDNALYYKNQAASQATAASTSADNAATSVTQAAAWVTGTTTPSTSPSATNNAMYYAGLANDAQEATAAWITGNAQTSLTPSATNNAMYWTEQSKGYANGKDLEDATISARATDNAKYYSDLAHMWSNGNVSSEDVPSAANNARSYAVSAALSADTISGYLDSITTLADQISDDASAASSAASSVSDDVTTVLGYKTSSQQAANDAKAWAIGTTDTSHAAYNNNALYYANSCSGIYSTLAGYLNSATISYGITETINNINPETDITWVTPNPGDQPISPESGKYYWTRTLLTWNDENIDDTAIYNVGFVGADAGITSITNAQIDALFA